MQNRNRILKTLLLSAVLSLGASAQTMVTTTSGASYGPVVAPDSIAVVWGMNFSTATFPSTALPLPTTLGGTQVNIVDSTGAKLGAAQLYMVAAGQINFLVPANIALGKATVTVTSGGSTIAQGMLLVSNVAPSIFTADMTGKGVPAAQVLRVTPAGVPSIELPFRAGAGTSFVAVPINVSSADKLYLMLYGTGIRRHSLNPVKATIAGINVPVLYAGPQSQYPGLDQVNLGPLPQTLAGKGEVDLVLTVDGVPANVVRVAFQ